jgi:hypothetical protein
MLPLAVVPFLLIAAYAHPIADDFCYAILGSYGSLDIPNLPAHASPGLDSLRNAQIFHYTQWSGRYFSTIFLTSYSLILDFFAAYKYIPVFIFLVLFLSMFALFRAIASASRLLSKSQSFWGALALFVIYIVALPATSEGFYWFAGSITYEFGAATMLFLIALLVSGRDFATFKPYKKVLYVLSCCLLTIMAAGFNEMLALVLICVLALGTVVTVWTRHPSSTLWKIALATSLVGTMIVVLAPGNFHRLDTLSRWDTNDFNYSFLYSVVYFVYKTLKYLVLWILNPVVLSATVILLPISSALAKRMDFLKGLRYRHFVVFTGYWLGVVVFAFLMPFLTRGVWAIRTLDFTHLIFLFGWFLSVFLLAAVLEKHGRGIIVPQYILVSAKIAMIFGIVFHGNFNQSLEDSLLTSRARNYHKQQENRYALVRQALRKGEKTATVPALDLPVFPLTIATSDDLKPNPTAFQNVCFAKYFGLGSIVVQPVATDVKANVSDR